MYKHLDECYIFQSFCFAREHLGVEGDEVNIADIICDDFYKDVWIKQAATNTTMFEKVCSGLDSLVIIIYQLANHTI